jgi:hypothetical protein|nr:MAG TPA: M23 peptidase domain protein membrane, HYDROLASE.41A [Caudoviricetes sp.]
MKKSIVTVTAIVATAMTMWFATPVQPHHYELHVVKGGETLTSIVEDANRNSNVSYDIREAVSTAVSESSKMEGGATSRSIKPGDKIAVPIYR